MRFNRLNFIFVFKKLWTFKENWISGNKQCVKSQQTNVTEDTKLNIPVKTRKQFVFVDTYRCFNMSIVILIFFMEEDLFS